MFKNFSVRYEISVVHVIYIRIYEIYRMQLWRYWTAWLLYEKKKLIEYFISFKEFNQNRYKDLCTKLRQEQ